MTHFDLVFLDEAQGTDIENAVAVVRQFFPDNLNIQIVKDMLHMVALDILKHEESSDFLGGDYYDVFARRRS